MTIYRLYKNRPFEPEALAMMSNAYADVCRTLGLSDRDHLQVNVVAKTVIEYAQRGVRDPIHLRNHVLHALQS